MVRRAVGLQTAGLGVEALGLIPFVAARMLVGHGRGASAGGGPLAFVRTIDESLDDGGPAIFGPR